MEREENKLLRMSEAEMIGRFGSGFCKDIKELIRKAEHADDLRTPLSPDPCAVTPWVSVKDRLPKPYTKVAVAFKTIAAGNVEGTDWTSGFINEVGGWVHPRYNGRNVKITNRVTHWRKIGLPKTEKKFDEHDKGRAN